MARIMIVEPDRLLAGNLAGRLKKHGHAVVSTPDAQAAINAADNNAPEVIILELLLAGRSGIELLYELRSYPDWAEIPVIIYTHVHPAELPASCYDDLNIRCALYKPAASIADLADEIEQALAAPVQ